MSIAFTFPGQGSQQVGMGRALAEAFPVARAVFAEVDEALEQKLSAVMWDGPTDSLTLTENAQPALMAVSLAVVRVLESEHGVTVGGAYTAYPSPNNSFTTVKELSFRLAADDRYATGGFVLRPHVLVAMEFDTAPGIGQADGGESAGTYLEAVAHGAPGRRHPTP